MERRRKTVFKGFGYMQCDDFAAYLSEMATKGWHFKEWKAGLVFEKGVPEAARYAVEVFVDGSEYDTRPDVNTLEFAEYCEAAGWKLVDAKRKFVIFKKLRPDAVEILTPRERFENIAREVRKEMFRTLGLSYAWVILQLLTFTGSQFVNRIYSNSHLLVVAVWLSLAFFATVKLIHYLFWHRKSNQTIRNGGSVYFGGRKGLLSWEHGWYSWISNAILFAYVGCMFLFGQYYVAIIVLAFTIILTAMAFAISYFRPDSGTNMVVQSVVSVAILIGVFAAATWIMLSDDSSKPITPELPLYYEDIGGSAGAIEKVHLDSSTSIFGTGMRCWIDYEEEFIYYQVYTSDQEWIVDRIWKNEMKYRYNQNGQDVTELFGAEEAIRNKNNRYLVKFDDAVWILDFGPDTLLTAQNVSVIRDALSESR